MELIKFELNNWFAGDDYPNEEPFNTWLDEDLNQYFLNEKWVKENKLVVTAAIIDMSFNYCIVAPKEWVIDNCPALLDRYKEFVRDKSSFDIPFREYVPDNFGIRFWNWDMNRWETHEDIE